MNEMRELTDMEVEAVAGGLFDFGNVNIQPNIGLQVGVAIGGFSVFGNGGSAGVGQLLGQTRLGAIA